MLNKKDVGVAVVLNEMVSRGGREELCGRWDGSDGVAVRCDRLG